MGIGFFITRAIYDVDNRETDLNDERDWMVRKATIARRTIYPARPKFEKLAEDEQILRDRVSIKRCA